MTLKDIIARNYAYPIMTNTTSIRVAFDKMMHIIRCYRYSYTPSIDDPKYADAAGSDLYLEASRKVLRYYKEYCWKNLNWFQRIYYYGFLGMNTWMKKAFSEFC